jgi:hypothetical protein
MAKDRAARGPLPKRSRGGGDGVSGNYTGSGRKPWPRSGLSQGYLSQISGCGLR